MPRDGSHAQNGPFEEGNIVHGNAGDATLQHAKNNVAPMPEAEKGAAIEGMNASGGGNAPDQDKPTVAGDEPKKA